MVTAHHLPRFVVAAPASGHGKTTVATGVMAALRAAGHEVSGHKVGPDYIDPGYHSLATGRPGRNLDPHLVGEDLLVPLLLHGAATPRPASVAVIEGVMGLFDGAIGRNGYASTAHVASLISAPVVLVVDISSASRSIAALVKGMATFDPDVHVSGVILNKAGSPRHALEVGSALAGLGIPVLGTLSRDDGIVAPSRHLGLVPADERDDARATLQRLAEQIAANVDLDALLSLADQAPDLVADPWDPRAALAAAGLDPADGSGERPVVAVAGGRAFTFRYAETVELLEAGGCEAVPFDPLVDAALPAATSAIYLGGGFPEVHAAGLTSNEPLRRALRSAIDSGVPTVAECAGLLYLAESVDASPMVGAVPAEAAMSPRLTLRYQQATAPSDTLLGLAGSQVTGHEFHRTNVAPAAGRSAAWEMHGAAAGFSADPAGTGAATVHASYLHVHWAGYPNVAARFIRATRESAARQAQRPTTAPDRPRLVHSAPAAPVVRTWAPTGQLDLDHHGDREVSAGLVDFAVNVAHDPRPGWLDDVLTSSLASLDAYPDPHLAHEAIAKRHLRHASEVLATAGAAEAFTLIARSRAWAHAVVVHPQFTEPEVALRTAGHTVHRVVLDADSGFALDARRIPDEADLVVVGNPTNPTGRLHPASVLRDIARPGRTLVVDEAFMDAVPGERESLTAARIPGLVVVRSLTKTWSIPGLRAGYVLADPATIDRLARQQPPWSVSGPALAAMVACCSGMALAEAARRAAEVVRRRQVLTAGLADLRYDVVGNPATPFVLVDTSTRRPAGSEPGQVREQLRAAGFAVRRGDTFPGLGPDWVRIAVREPGLTRCLLGELAAISTRLDLRVSS